MAEQSCFLALLGNACDNRSHLRNKVASAPAELHCKTPDCMKTFCSQVNVVTVFYCHEPLVSSSGRTGSVDVKVKEEGVIAGAQGFREVQVQSKILCRKYTSLGYRQENVQKAQTDVKKGWSKNNSYQAVLSVGTSAPPEAPLILDSPSHKQEQTVQPQTGDFEEQIPEKIEFVKALDLNQKIKQFLVLPVRKGNKLDNWENRKKIEEQREIFCGGEITTRHIQVLYGNFCKRFSKPKRVEVIQECFCKSCLGFFSSSDGKSQWESTLHLFCSESKLEMSICHSLTEIIGIRTGSCRWDLMIYFKTGDVSNLSLSPQPPSLRKELMRYDFCENVAVKAWVKLALGKCGYASTHSLSGEAVLVGGGSLKINCTGTGAVLQACERVTVHHLSHCLKSSVVVMTEMCLDLGIVVVKAAAGLLFLKGQDGEAVLGQWPPGWIGIRQLMFSSGIFSLLCKQRHCSAAATQLLLNLNLDARTAAVGYSPKLLFASPISSPYDRVFLLCLGFLRVPLHALVNPCFTSIPFMEPHPYCIPGYLHSLLPLPFPRTRRACLLHPFLMHCIAHGAPHNPCSTLSSQETFPPSDFLGGNCKKWHILATGAVSALHGIYVKIKLFKGSLISKMSTEVEGLFGSWAVSFPKVALKPVNTHTVLLIGLGCEHSRLETKQVSFGALLCSVLLTFLPKISLWSGYLPHLSFISVALPGFDTIFASDHFVPTCAASFESLGDLIGSRSLLQSERAFCSLGYQSKHLSLAFPEFIPKQHLTLPEAETILLLSHCIRKGSFIPIYSKEKLLFLFLPFLFPFGKNGKEQFGDSYHLSALPRVTGREQIISGEADQSKPDVLPDVSVVPKMVLGCFVLELPFLLVCVFVCVCVTHAWRANCHTGPLCTPPNAEKDVAKNKSQPLTESTFMASGSGGTPGLLCVLQGLEEFLDYHFLPLCSLFPESPVSDTNEVFPVSAQTGSSALALPGDTDARKTGTNPTRESTNREEQSTYPAQDWIVLFTLVKRMKKKAVER
ncbi:hypothetical protein EK904_002251 [Melospiza melodia maxima]|nr:hypothetical protein EK904_002251 [Melospiza melodia maxima]